MHVCIRPGETFISQLTTLLEALVFRVTDEAARTQAKRVREAVRQADPLSHEELLPLEAEIAGRIGHFVELAEAGADEAAAVADELTLLLIGRDNRCKQLR